MKQNKLFKLWLLAVILLAGSGVTWGQLSEGFETGLPTSYTTTTSYTLSSGVWTGQSNGIISSNTTGVNSGTYSLQIRSQTGAQIITPTLTGGVGTISFYVTASTASGAYQVNISTDNGVSWSPATGSPFTIGTTKTPKSITVNNINVNKIQFYRTGATIYIDDVVITTAAVSGNTVTFNSNGGTGTMSNQTASTATNLTTNSFTRTGYTFAGWNTAANGSGTAYADGASYSFAANTTLYAQWTINSYNVSFDGNGNTSGTPPTTQSGNYNTSITLSANTGSLVKTGFAFDGWNTAANGLGTSYATGASFTIPASNTTLYAKWASTSPAINVSGTLTALTTTYGTASSNTSFIVSGLNLTDNVVVTAPTGFEVSLSAGSGFAGSLSLTPTTGTLANTTIYVRLKANAPASSYTSQVISCVSTLDGVTENVSIPTSTVNQKALTISGLTGVNREYDASTAATFSGTPTLVGVVSGDDVTLGGTGSASFATKSIGTNKSVSVSGFSISGTHATNYTLTQPTGLTANITAKALTVSGAEAQNKVYDANTTAVITGATLVGIISPDVVTVSGGGVFASANVATGISVTSNLTLGGADATNYTLTQPTGLTAEITKANPVFTTSTISVTTGGTYSLPGANITSTSPGTLSYSITGSGTIATLVGTTITGVTAGTETLTVNQAASTNYNAGSTTVSVVVSSFNNGDFRSTGDGTWHSTVSSSTSTWESFNGSTWVSSSAPGTNAASLGTKTVYIRNTITLVGSNTAPNVVVENTGILNTSTVTSTFGNLLVKNGGTFNRESNGSGVSGVFEVEDGGLFTFKHTNGTSRSSTIWAGTEKFHPNSTFKIVTVDASAMLVIENVNDVSTYSENGVTACFGNIIIDCSTGKLNLVPSGFNKQLTHKDLIFRTNSDTTPLSTGDLTTTIGGDLIIESTYLQTINFASTASTLNITVKGNFTHNGTKVFRPTSNLAANSTFNIEGDLSLTNGGSFIMNNGTGALTGTSIVNLKGNLNVSSTSIINSTATGSNAFNFNGIGDGLTPATTQSMAIIGALGSNVAFNVNKGADVKINQNLTLAATNPLTVKAGGKLTLINGKSLTTTPALTIQSDGTNGTGTYVDENTGTGLPAITGTVNQAVTTGRYWYVASPVSSAASTVLGTSPVYFYNADASPSKYETTTTTLSPGVGYSVSPSGTNFVFSGTLNNGNKTATIAYNGNTSDAFRGYNLIGNPYPSALNWNYVWANTANKSAVKSTVWFNANGTFETYNASGSVGVPSDVKGYIPPMQGFWVLATDAASSTTYSNKTLALDNTMRSHGPATGSNPLRAPQSAASENQLIRLQATNGIATDEMVLYFNSQAADTYDNYDSRKMMSSNAAQIYTLLDGMPIVINGMNTIPYNAEIPVAFKTVTAGEHTIKATEFSNFTSGESLLLTDKTLNRVTDLSSSDYTFTSSVGTDVNRFALTIQRVSTSVAGNNTQNSLQVVQSAGQIQILLPSFESGAVAYVFNNIGQITAKSSITGTVTTMSQNLPAGVYIVKVMTGTDELTEKIIVK